MEGALEAVGVLRVGRTSEAGVTTLTFTGDLGRGSLPARALGVVGHAGHFKAGKPRL